MNSVTPLRPKDQRVVYGARCTWWDSIDKVALTSPGVSGIRIPCCPHCGSPLFEKDNEAAFMEPATRYEASGHPGYVDLVLWGRGQCFANFAALQLAYDEMSF
jgi:hypothetical protein